MGEEQVDTDYFTDLDKPGSFTYNNELAGGSSSFGWIELSSALAHPCGSKGINRSTTTCFIFTK